MNSVPREQYFTTQAAPATRRHAIVIGGGIVGTCCALYLQRSGFAVTLVDPAPPGDSTAKWSCGQMSVGEIIPLSKPGILLKVPGWLLDQEGPLALRPSALPGILPWFMRFLSCARQKKIADIATAMASLTSNVFADYASLLESIGDDALIGQRPIIEVFDSAKGIEHERPHIELRKSLGFDTQIIGRAEIDDLEPALKGRFSHGLLLPQWRFVSDTEGFLKALTNHFVANGGHRVQSAATRIEEHAGKATGVTLANGESLPAEHVVLAAGAASRRFFSQLDVSAPLEGVAGYQVLVSNPNVEFTHSVIYADGGFCFTPMTRGLQIGGTIEFAGRDARPNFRRAEIILAKAKKVLPELNTTKHEFGVGYRPFLPDTKPIIDRSKRLPNVLLALGHGQLGLTLGATTGRLIAELACGTTPRLDLAPFSAQRFG
ncbi:NAD(P)/FAD-dependent oxidoreductase [Caballeronia sp. J97]|uniref:NAD(P)/FAD-dependent oxidoreductase n=1 Tax=Caballeronia sp. J97 TaxID=2805429 RepID=UPI002AAF6592|nr:FAD-dependent oxidoreductase [Caballeronia sp. J97]